MADDFDPKQYLAEKTASADSGFDPKKYLAEKTGQADTRSLGNKVVDALGSFGKSVNDAYTEGLGAVGDGLRSALGIAPPTPEEIAEGKRQHDAFVQAQSYPGILKKDSPDWLAAANAFVSAMPGFETGGHPSAEHQERAARFTREYPWWTLGLGAAGGMAVPMPAGVPGVKGPVTGALENAARGLETGAEELAARVPAGTAGQYSAMNTAKRRGMGKLLLDEKAISPSSLNLRSVAEKLPEIEAKTGGELTDAIAALDKTGGQFNKRDLVNHFLDLADKERAMGPGATNVRNKYLLEAKRIADDIEENGAMMSFADAEKYKQGYQNRINYSKAHRTPLEEGTIEVAGRAKQAVEDAAQTTAEGANDPALLQNFLDAKKRSGYAQTANEMTNAPGGSIGRLEARGMIGPTARMGGWMAATTQAAAGHPVGAVSSVALPPVAQAFKSRAVGAMALGARSASENLARIAAMEPERLGRFAGVLRPALNNGSGNMDEFNARSYALSQTEPDFQALTKQLSEQQK